MQFTRWKMACIAGGPRISGQIHRETARGKHNCQRLGREEMSAGAAGGEKYEFGHGTLMFPVCASNKARQISGLPCVADQPDGHSGRGLNSDFGQAVQMLVSPACARCLLLADVAMSEPTATGVSGGVGRLFTR